MAADQLEDIWRIGKSSSAWARAKFKDALAKRAARLSVMHLVVNSLLALATLGLFGATCALVRATRDLPIGSYRASGGRKRSWVRGVGGAVEERRLQPATRIRAAAMTVLATVGLVVATGGGG